MLLVIGLGYFSFTWFDTLTARGVYSLGRLRARSSYTVIHTCFQQGETRDCLVWSDAYRADRSRHAVRLVRFYVDAVPYTYLT